MRVLVRPGAGLRRSASPGIGAFVLLVLTSGCGSSATLSSGLEDTAEYQGMKNLGEMYRIVSASLKRPPKNISELRQAEAEVPGGFSTLGETNVAIFFNAELPGASDKS